MKKTYFAPEMEFSTLYTADIIATSVVNNEMGDLNMLSRESLGDFEWE